MILQYRRCLNLAGDGNTDADELGVTSFCQTLVEPDLPTTVCSLDEPRVIIWGLDVPHRAENIPLWPDIRVHRHGRGQTEVLADERSMFVEASPSREPIGRSSRLCVLGVSRRRLRQWR